MNNNGLLLVVSAPSGCGKDTIIAQVIEKLKGDAVLSVSMTTRDMREGEEEGINYFYVSKDEFFRHIEEGDMLEYTIYGSNYYGTPINPVKTQLSNGKVVILIIEVEEEEEKEVLLKELVGKNSKLDEIYKQFPLWFKYVMELEGLPKSRGRHASATLITPHPVIEHMPLCLDNDKNVMAQLEMHAAMDKLGYCKMDYLGLENLDIIDDTLKMSNLTWSDVDINHLDVDDKHVFKEVYSSGNTIGVFQFESAEARRMSIDAHVDNIEDCIVVNAANRPGTKASFPEYCENKLHPELAEFIHEDLRELFSKTYGFATSPYCK